MALASGMGSAWRLVMGSAWRLVMGSAWRLVMGSAWRLVSDLVAGLMLAWSGRVLLLLLPVGRLALLLFLLAAPPGSLRV
jgi:hypothetical protein